MIQLDLPHMSTSPDTIAVSDLTHFIELLSHWHTTKVNVLKHMKDIPESAEVSIGDGESIPVTGAFREGFQLGLSLALSELGVLPFVAELEESAAIELKH